MKKCIDEKEHNFEQAKQSENSEIGPYETKHNTTFSKRVFCTKCALDFLIGDIE